MKINEAFHEPLEDGPEDSSFVSQSKIATQMRAEFEDFVAQTRDRLRLVAEALAELDRELSGSPVSDSSNFAEEIPQHGSADQNVEHVAHVEESIEEDSIGWFDTAVPEEPQGGASDSQVEAWFDSTTEPKRPRNDEEDASNDANFRYPPESERSVPGNHRDDSQEDREGFSRSQEESPVDRDSDPFERLKAIKERLARQIEKS